VLASDHLPLVVTLDWPLRERPGAHLA